MDKIPNSFPKTLPHLLSRLILWQYINIWSDMNARYKIKTHEELGGDPWLALRLNLQYNHVTN